MRSGRFLPKAQRSNLLFLLHELGMKLKLARLIVLIISKINGPDGNILGAGRKCDGTGVVIDNKLDDKIFEPSELTPWGIEADQLLSRKRSGSFFHFNVYWVLE